MHWREGFRRIARATGICYGVAAIVGVAAYGLGEGYAPTRSYQVQSEGWTYEVEAHDEQEAAQLVHRHRIELAKLPPSRELSGYTDAELGIVAGDGPFQVPGTNVRRRDWELTAQRAGEAAAWWLAIYVALWALFRGLRWIARGFLDGAGSGVRSAPPA